MTEQLEKEKNYLLKVFLNKLPNNNPFIVLVSEEKELLMISSGNDNSVGTSLSKITQYRDIYNTVLDLKNKIGFSLEKAIEYAYCKEVQEKYNMMHSSREKEWSAYYYIENAMFRVETLWDILAHIYNIKFDLEEPINKVYHSRIFSDRERYKNKYWNGAPPSEVIKIIDYINEEDDTSGEYWSGNYAFINSMRNNMTHKFSISQSNMSSFALEFKHHPSFILKRLCESFAMLQDFVYEVCESILIEMEENDYGE